MRNLILCCTIAFLFLVSLCSTSQATMLTADIFLDGLQEDPPVATPGTGTGTATFDTVSGALSVSGTFSDLIGTTTIAHVHGYSAVNVASGVVFGITVDLGVTSGSFSGNGVIPAGNIADVLNGLSYVNIHSTFKSGGEIRGQIMNFVPEPTSILLGVAGLGLLLLRRNRPAC